MTEKCVLSKRISSYSIIHDSGREGNDPYTNRAVWSGKPLRPRVSSLLQESPLECVRIAASQSTSQISRSSQVMIRRTGRLFFLGQQGRLPFRGQGPSWIEVSPSLDRQELPLACGCFVLKHESSASHGRAWLVLNRPFAGSSRHQRTHCGWLVLARSSCEPGQTGLDNIYITAQPI